MSSRLSAELHRPDTLAARITGVHNSSVVSPHSVRVISSMATPIQLDVLLPVAACFLAAFAYTLRHARSRGLPYPPGPKRFPIIGNLLDMPSHEEWLTYKKWSDQYGRTPQHVHLHAPHATLIIPGSDVVHVDVLGTHMVIVNSTRAAKELFDKRSSIYSDRYFKTCVVANFYLIALRPSLVALNCM